MVIFWGTFKIGNTSANLVAVFPGVNCTVISDTYGTYLEDWAVADYEILLAWQDNGREQIQTRGCLECFCTAEIGASNID